MSKPVKIENGEHKGKTHCPQYACKNNCGVQKGIVTDSSFPSGCCKIESPDIIDFGNDSWGCKNEKYEDN